MRSSFNVTTQDVDDEIQAIKALRELGEHPNLVRILRDGPLDHSTYHFIDMEPCDINLLNYIRGERSGIPTVDDTPPAFPSPSFVERDCPLTLKLRNIYTIMSHIAGGLAFIHQHNYVHRDLKPENSTSLRQ